MPDMVSRRTGTRASGRKASIPLIALTSLAVWLPASAWAASVSYADIDLQFLITGTSAADASAVGVEAWAGLFDQGELVSPGGWADSSFTAAVLGSPSSLGIGVGEGLRLGAGTLTGAVGPSGLADAFRYTDGWLTLSNASSEPVQLDFALFYDLSANAAADSSQDEAAFARSALGLESSLFGILFHAAAEADTIFGPLTASILDSLSFSLQLEPWQRDKLYLTADAESSAVSLAPIPVPPAVALLVAAIGSLVLVRRRRSR